MLYTKEDTGKALREAASKGLAHEVVKLLQQDIKLVNQKGLSGLTALHFACGYSRPEVRGYNPQGDYYKTICMLMAYGADADLKCGQQQQSAIEYANHDKFMQNLIKISKFISPVRKEILTMQQISGTERLDVQYNISMRATAYHDRLANFVNIAAHIQKQDEPYSIVSFGSGKCEEFFAVKLFFEDLNLKFKYIGLDINPELLEVANIFIGTDDNFKSMCVDATNLGNVKSAIAPLEQVDLCIVRHPNYSDVKTAAPFNTMFSDVIPKITKATAPVIISFYSSFEYNAFARAQLMPIASPYSLPTQTELTAIKNPKYREEIPFSCALPGKKELTETKNSKNREGIVPDNLLICLHLNDNKPSVSLESVSKALTY